MKVDEYVQIIKASKGEVIKFTDKELKYKLKLAVAGLDGFYASEKLNMYRNDNCPELYIYITDMLKKVDLGLNPRAIYVDELTKEVFM